METDFKANYSGWATRFGILLKKESVNDYSKNTNIKTVKC